jgi:hypothetical protein
MTSATVASQLEIGLLSTYTVGLKKKKKPGTAICNFSIVWNLLTRENETPKLVLLKKVFFRFLQIFYFVEKHLH